MKAVADVFAAILGVLGFVGRPRLREGIRHDLELLDELESRKALFGQEMWCHDALKARIQLDVGRLSGVKVKQRKIPWNSVVLAVVLGGPAGYLTYKLNVNGFDIWSLLPGALAVFMGVGLLGLVLGALSDDDEPQEPGEGEGDQQHSS